MRRALLVAVIAACTLIPVAGAHADDDAGDQGAPPAGQTPPSEPGEPSEPAPTIGEADPEQLPSGPGEPSEPMPTGSAPGELPVGQTLEDGDIYGACADQGPLISGQLLVRLNIAVDQSTTITDLRVEAENARVKEIELPYHAWDITYDENAAKASGPGRAKKSFWFWVALDRIDENAERVIVKSFATTDAGKSIAHDVVDGMNTPGRYGATIIPLDENFKPVELPRDPAAPADAPDAPRETPAGGRVPCLVDGPLEEADNGTFGGVAGVLLGGGVGVFVGAAAILLLRRRRG